MGRQRDVDDSDWSGFGEEKRRAGFEWGLASLLMGGILAMMAPIMLVSNILIFIQAGKMLSEMDLTLAFVAALVGFVGVLALSITSIVFGVRGVRRARWFDMPTGVPVAGILVSIAAVFLWIVVGLDLISVLQSVR